MQIPKFSIITPFSICCGLRKIQRSCFQICCHCCDSHCSSKYRLCKGENYV